MTILDQIRAAYIASEGEWTGCDWTTDHGATRLDLDGCRPAELRYAADRVEDCGDYPHLRSLPRSLPRDVPAPQSEYLQDDDWAERYVDDLRSGADWLDEVAADARAAEEAAARAMAALECADYDVAIEHIDHACAIESKYGASPTWGPVRDAIRAFATAARERDIPDGWYLAHAAGSRSAAYQFCDGEIVNVTITRDDASGTPLPGDLQRSIVGAISTWINLRLDPELVIVERMRMRQPTR